jgi:DNA ligase-4
MQVGNCVHAQLAKRSNSAEAAVAAMKNESFLVETKFDGNRIQLHYWPGGIEYFTRQVKEYAKRG